MFKILFLGEEMFRYETSDKGLVNNFHKVRSQCMIISKNYVYRYKQNFHYGTPKRSWESFELKI